MGLFDDIICKFPLPVNGANALDYQTKDTPAQWMDKYEIREDGTLWHEAYETEDQSEAGKWKREHPDAKPEDVPEFDALSGFVGCMTRVNKRWEQVMLTGEIRFYTSKVSYDAMDIGLVPKQPAGWIEWSAYFLSGQLQQMNLIENRDGDQ